MASVKVGTHTQVLKKEVFGRDSLAHQCEVEPLLWSDCCTRAIFYRRGRYLQDALLIVTFWPVKFQQSQYLMYLSVSKFYLLFSNAPTLGHEL